ncbi:MAG: phosphoribosylformylglycinamidine synthase subunit PurL [Bacillota bacterium]
MSESVWKKVGLTEDEYSRLCHDLGREPNGLELGIYGLMWSEHCSYKSSKKYLAELPTSGTAVLQGPGENAGVVDIGEDIAVAFRIESHNHPSAVEPVQGAATGIGGILRDIFAMGARPIALLDSLRFGNLGDPRVRFLFEGVVSGISSYGNCVGVPTVGGEVYFDGAYRENPLVNVMCVGLVDRDRLVRGLAGGEDSAVILVGAPTGRDGIHGASLLASREFRESPEDMRPAVQVGDPFREKLLIEACLEAMQGDAVVGVNDLGAAGLASACSETASRAGSGMWVDVALVPRREEGMTPYEVMLSESQERMLVIARSGREEEVLEVFGRWDLDAVVIGRVTGDGLLRIRDEGEEIGAIPVDSITEGGPIYDRPRTVTRSAVAQEMPSTLDLADPSEALLRIMAHPNHASRRPVFEQYDHMVGINTVVPPGAGEAAVLRVKGTEKGIACVTDGNGFACSIDPRRGAALTVAEAYRNICSVGARPLAITNCLNFGNPEVKEVMGDFVEVIAGMGEACRELDTPVTGGNVSFYNETNGRQIFPTPVVGMVGVLDNVDRYATGGFKGRGDAIILLGEGGQFTGASEYLKIVHGIQTGPIAGVDYSLEMAVGTACRRAVAEGLVQSSIDISGGGLAVALAEGALSSPWSLGATIDLRSVGEEDLRAEVFGEDGSRILVSVPAEHVKSVLDLAAECGCPARRIGRVGGDRVKITAGDETYLDVLVSDLESVWERGLE